MSRIANNPVVIPAGVEVKIDGNGINVKGPKGDMQFAIHDSVQIEQEDNILTFSLRENSREKAMAGTARAVVNNMVTGVSQGFERKLQLVGVGYRAQAQGATLNLSLGHSHPINYAVPDGITVETPSQTEILVKGCDKQKVGQVAAEIRAYRPPEPYKGKGVKYSDEVIVRKEAKKK